VAFAVTLRLPPKTGQEVPQEAIVTFHSIGLRFGLEMEGRRNHVFVRFPVVTRYSLEGIAFDALP